MAVKAWDEQDWKTLLLSIKRGRCTPFLGAGACYGLLPKGADLAQRWAREFQYPFADSDSLVRVSQYVATMRGNHRPREQVSEDFARHEKINPDASNPLLQVLARLPFQVYLTTNYDRHLQLELKRADREPVVHVCHWHQALGQRFPRLRLAPSEKHPVVYHLHGSIEETDSIVITEDDYIEFLAAVAAQPQLLPAAIEKAFGNTMLLFLGYSLEDLDFRVLFRKLASYLSGNGFTHAAVQLSPSIKEGDAEYVRVTRQIEYIVARYASLRIRLYLGNCDTFARDLSEQWKAYVEGGE